MVHSKEQEHLEPLARGRGGRRAAPADAGRLRRRAGLEPRWQADRLRLEARRRRRAGALRDPARRGRSPAGGRRALRLPGAEVALDRTHRRADAGPSGSRRQAREERSRGDAQGDEAAQGLADDGPSDRGAPVPLLGPDARRGRGRQARRRGRRDRSADGPDAGLEPALLDGHGARLRRFGRRPVDRDGDQRHAAAVPGAHQPRRLRHPDRRHRRDARSDRVESLHRRLAPLRARRPVDLLHARGETQRGESAHRAGRSRLGREHDFDDRLRPLVRRRLFRRRRQDALRDVRGPRRSSRSSDSPPTVPGFRVSTPTGPRRGSTCGADRSSF